MKLRAISLSTLAIVVASLGIGFQVKAAGDDQSWVEHLPSRPRLFSRGLYQPERDHLAEVILNIIQPIDESMANELLERLKGDQIAIMANRFVKIAGKTISRFPVDEVPSAAFTEPFSDTTIISLNMLSLDGWNKIYELSGSSVGMGGVGEESGSVSATAHRRALKPGRKILISGQQMRAIDQANYELAAQYALASVLVHEQTHVRQSGGNVGEDQGFLVNTAGRIMGTGAMVVSPVTGFVESKTRGKAVPSPYEQEAYQNQVNFLARAAQPFKRVAKMYQRRERKMLGTKPNPNYRPLSLDEQMKAYSASNMESLIEGLEGFFVEAGNVGWGLSLHTIGRDN